MDYDEIRFNGPVRVGSRDGVLYASGPRMSIVRNGDTVTLSGPDGIVVDCPWSSVLFAKRKSVVAAPEKTQPSRAPNRTR